MESLSRALYPYKDIVGQMAAVLTIGQFLSGVFICKDIYKKGSTEGISAIPFVGGVCVGCLFYKYGLLLNDPATTVVNIGSIVLHVLYTAFYYLYSRNRSEELLKPLGVGAVLAGVILGYAEIENPNLVEFRFGIIVTILLIALMAAPLKDIKSILANQDASSIPFPLTFMGCIVTLLWLLYAIILNNSFMLVQNLVALFVCGLQLSLIFMYPGRPQDQKDKRKKRVKKD